MKVSFIGFGNIAQAIAQGLGPLNYQLYAASPSLKEATRSDGIKTSPNNLKTIVEADVIILAVKPAKMAEVLAEIKEKLPKNSLLISVAAGLSRSWLEKETSPDQAIVRSMPNTPIAVGKGATMLIANDQVTPQQRHWAETIFQRSGIVAWTTDEAQLNAFTALAGSGPAYVFLFVEALIKSAIQLGLDEGLAKTFALQTVSGALELANQSGLEIAQLRKKVTSPAGTTAAAIDILQKEGFETILFKAMKAACDRAQQLGSD